MRISSITLGRFAAFSMPLSFGSHESNLPSICLNLNEHMKNTQRQKITSTIGTTLIATGFSLGSCEPAIANAPSAGGAGEGLPGGAGGRDPGEGPDRRDCRMRPG